ncbi:MAG TPA: hypothetical protein VEA69_16275 [Tepidisphaeraceae bacterium]|nr:hypothetical protein [Tepidisphaeraceae bacterium]
MLKIPLPGGSGPAKSGAIQFRDDWPGPFLRGDTAIMVGLAIRNLQKALDQSQDGDVASALSKLAVVADLIEREVIVK